MAESELRLPVYKRSLCLPVSLSCDWTTAQTPERNHEHDAWPHTQYQ